MNHLSPPPRLLRRLCAAAAAACVLSACGPEEPAPAERQPFRATPPEPRRAAPGSRTNSLWLEALRDLRGRITPMAERMMELQKFYAENNLDPLLELDPFSLETERLCSLFHFLERGCFTVEREIYLDLLERRAARPPAAPAPDAPRPGLKDRLAAAMQRDEQRLMDIESAIARYEKATGGEIRIPHELSPEELYELRTTVRRMMDETRARVDSLDARIAALKAGAP